MPHEGEILGTYKLIRQLGGGAFGEVWLVQHLDLEVRRAMKIPTDPDYVKQLRREGKIQFALQHANIVQTVDLNTRHDPPYFVMEYVEGEDLRKRLSREGQLPLKAVLGIVWKVLRALEAAHGEGVLHRDLKPENVLITPDDEVKVTDFGLGKVQAEVTQSLLLSGSMVSVAGKSVSGTFEYMSPEQRAGQEATPRDDIYALGILACELLTGRRPAAAGVGRTLRRAKVPAAICEVVEKACDEFEYRYATAGAMLADLASRLKRKEAAEPAPEAPPREEAPPPKPAPPPPPPPPRPEPTPRPAARRAPADLETSSVGIKLQLIGPGTFRMGSDNGTDNERPVHKVSISRPFYLGVCPVTQAEYERVMGVNPAKLKGPSRPVERVSWEEAEAFCHRLSELEGIEYRLPTEAEWEYACRAGSEAAYCFGDDATQIGDYGWFRDNSGRKTHDVGHKRPNAWGLCDMHGNVAEWCLDRYDAYAPGTQRDPSGPSYGEQRVLRGGSCCHDANACRSAFRHFLPPDLRSFDAGFRVVRPLL